MIARLIVLILLSVPASCAAVAADYREVILASEPSIYWRFENSNSNLVHDESGLVDAQSIAAGPGRRGVSGLAAAFDRSRLAGRVEARLTAEQHATVERILNSEFTLEFWFLDEAAAPDNKTNYSLFYKADMPRFTRNSMWFYRTRQDGHYHFRIHGATGEPAGLTVENPAGDKAAGDGEWHYMVIAVSRSETDATMRAFVDGRPVAETPFSPEITIDNQGPLVVGNGIRPNSPWQGLIDEFAIYPRILSEDDIQRHYAAGVSALKQPVKTLSTLALREEFFELKIRPLLIEKCADCHTGEADSESVLSVSSRNALLSGGDFGPAIIPGRSEDSILIHATRRIHKILRMPPDKADALSRQEVTALARWIDDGAVWPKREGEPPEATSPQDSEERKLTLNASKERELTLDGSQEGELTLDGSQEGELTLDGSQEGELTLDPVENWAFLPRDFAAPPKIDDPRWNRLGIDRFLEHARRDAGLTAAPRADRRTLIRRATFDLIGLPPSPEEVTRFLADTDDDTTAYAKVVDRLLGSRHYGERAGRLWLDVARYADTQGDVGDIPIQTAWLYRNWVIDSHNDDLPFDEFVRAQIAGDLIARDVADEKTARGLTVATGFIALSRRFGNTKKDDIHLTIEDTIDTVGRGVLGLTLRCARCHDHKFDPVLNADYYGLYGIFESTVYPWMGMSNEKSPSALSPAIQNEKAFEYANRYWELITRYEYQNNNHFRPWLKPTLDEFKSISLQLESEPAPEELKRLQTRREQLLGFRGGKFRELMLHGLDWIRKEKLRLAENPEQDFVFAVSEGAPHDAKIQRRGNPRRLGETTPRRFLQAIDGATPPKIVAGSGRLELARWLTRPEHPLTARVIVNRIWQQHFGRGLVATPDNFGRQGSRPSHPRLLDWLAEEFVREGWSLKKLHRQLMLTESYQLSSSRATESSIAADPLNIYVTRFVRRRLDAESIRDSLLAVSGQLDRTQGKAHSIAPWYKSRFSLNKPFHAEPPSNQRSVYLLTQRLFRHSFLGLFDGPDRNSSTSIRSSSSVPSQALFLMNSELVREQSRMLASRLVSEADSDDARISRLCELAFGRQPDGAERESFREFLTDYRSTAGSKNADRITPPELVALCRAVLTSNEFFFID